MNVSINNIIFLNCKKLTFLKPLYFLFVFKVISSPIQSLSLSNLTIYIFLFKSTFFRIIKISFDKDRIPPETFGFLINVYRLFYKRFVFDYIHQDCPTRGPRAACSLALQWMWPNIISLKTFEIYVSRYIYSLFRNMNLYNTWSFFQK